MASVQRRIVHKQFNSPIAMYSDNNVKETLNRELKVLSSGAVGINFDDPSMSRAGALAKSAVMQALEEEERQKMGQQTDEMERGNASPPTTTMSHVEARKGRSRSRSRHRIIDREAVLKINRRHRSCEFAWPPVMENQPLTNTNSQRFDKNIITKKKIAEIKQFFDNYEDNLKEPWHMTATERNTKSCDNLTSSSNSAENEHFHLKCYKNDGSKIFRGNKNRRPKTPTTETTTFNHSHWPPSISTSLSTPNLSIEVLTKTVASLPKPLNKYFYLPEEKIHSNELNKIRQHFDKSNDKHNYTIGSECIQVKNQSENEKKITTKYHDVDGDGGGGGDGKSSVIVTITPPECSYTNILQTNKTCLATTAPKAPTKSKKLLKKSSAKAEKEKLMNESSTLIKKNNLPPVKPPRHAPISNIKVKSSNTRSTTTTSHTAELIKNKKKLYNNDSNQNEIQQQLGNVISLLELKQDDNKHGTRDYQTDLKQIKSSTISKQHSKLMNDDCKLQQQQQQHQQQQQQHEDYLSTPIGTQNEYFNNQNRQPKQQQQQQQKMGQEKEEKQNNKKHGKNNCEINEISTTNSKINNRNNLNLDLFFDKELSMLSSLQHSLQHQQQQRQLQKQNTKPLEWQQQQQQEKKKQKEGQDFSTDKIAITHNKVELNGTKHHECNSSVEEFKLSNEMRSVGNNYDDDAFPVSLNADQYLSDSSSATTISTSSNLEIESLPDSTPMISTKKCPFCHCDEKDNEINKRRIFTDGEYIYGPYNFDLFSNEFYQFDDDDDERAGSSSRNKTTILLSNDNEHHIINSKLLKNHDEVDNLLLSSEILIRDTGVGYGNLHYDGDIYDNNKNNNNNNIDNDKVDGNVTTNDEPDLIILNDDKVSNEHFNYNQSAKKCDQCHYEHTTNSTSPTITTKTPAPSTVVIDGGDNYVSNKHDSCNVKNNFNKLNEELCVMQPTNKTHTTHSIECSDCVPDTVEKLVNFSEQFNYKRAKIVDITDENNQQKHSTYAYTIPLSNNSNNNTDEIDDEKCAKYVDESLNIIFNNGNNKQSGNEKEHYDDTQRHKISCEKSVCCCRCRCWEGADYLNGMNIFQFPLPSRFFDNCTTLSPSARYSLNIIKEQVAQWMNENSYLMLNPLNYHHLEAIGSSTNNNQSPFMQQTNNYYSYDICGNLNETDVEHQPSSSATTTTTINNNITYLPKNIVGCCRHLSAALTNINDYEQSPNEIVTLSSLPTDNNEITFNDDNENSCSHFNNNNNDERIFDINRSPAVEDSPTKAPLYSSSSVNAMPATTTMKNSKFNGFFGTELPCQSNENDLYALKECDENNNKRFVPLPLPLISNENTEKRRSNNNNSNEILADSSSNVCSTVAGDLLHSPPSTTSQGLKRVAWPPPPDTTNVEHVDQNQQFQPQQQQQQYNQQPVQQQQFNQQPVQQPKFNQQQQFNQQPVQQQQVPYENAMAAVPYPNYINQPAAVAAPVPSFQRQTSHKTAQRPVSLQNFNVPQYETFLANALPLSPINVKPLSPLVYLQNNSPQFNNSVSNQNSPSYSGMGNSPRGLMGWAHVPPSRSPSGNQQQMYQYNNNHASVQPAFELTNNSTSFGQQQNTYEASAMPLYQTAAPVAVSQMPYGGNPLRKEAPISQKPAPIYASQPVAATFQGGLHMRGDQKWPPQECKQQAVEENEARKQIAMGPAFRPKRVNKDYRDFFGRNALISTFSPYRVPPGTQHYGINHSSVE